LETEEIGKADKKTGKILTVYKTHHQKSEIYICKKERRKKRSVTNLSDI
jgi:hypothetical protein